MILRSTSWEEDAIAHLSRLQEAERRRQEAARADLARMVARLDWSPGTDEFDLDPQAPGRVLPPTRPAGQSEPTLLSEAEIEAQLPRRTTHGGAFGPRVRAKLIAEIRRNSV